MSRREEVLNNLKTLEIKTAQRHKNHIKSQQMISQIKKKQYLHEANREKDIIKHL